MAFYNVYVCDDEDVFSLIFKGKIVNKVSITYYNYN